MKHLNTLTVQTGTGRIVFGGHYNLGELVRDVQFVTMLYARLYVRADRSPIGILIGDIDFNQKVAAYIRTGIEGVKDSYRKRLARTSSGCVRAQIPQEGELDHVIDEEQYDFASEMVRLKTPRLYHELKQRSLDVQETDLTGTHQSLARVLREEVIIPLTIRRRWGYEIQRDDPKPEVRLYSERELKNAVAKKMRPSRERTSDSWRIVRDAVKSPLVRAFLEEVQTPQGIPACRGIMLSLYELLVTEGFKECHQHYSIRDERAVQHATDLYNALHKEFPDDARWKLNITNTFYREKADITNSFNINKEKGVDDESGGTDHENSGYC